jgi:hypothetical protein
MANKISSIKHPEDKHVYIPSTEEAGYEDANPKVLIFNNLTFVFFD